MRKDRDTLVLLSEELLAYGKSKGATEMEISISDGSEFSVDFREGKIERLVEAGQQRLALRVFVEGKVARASSSDLSKDTLTGLVENAIERAKIATADQYAGLPENETIEVETDALEIFDPKIVEMPPEKKINAARETEAICLKDKRIKKSYGASFSTTVGEVVLANSNGFSSSYKRTSCSCGVGLQTGEGENLFDEGWSDSSVNLHKLLPPEEIAKIAIQRATRLIGGRKVDTQIVPVVFEYPMTGSLLSFLYTCVSGRNIYLKQSFLAEKIGERIGVDLVTVIDDGLIPGAPGTKPFDSEGVAAGKTTVIESGVLKSYLVDTYAGRKLNMKSTGNASGANNLYLAPGKHTPKQIIKSVDKGLLLTGTIGFGLVPTTGDISRGAVGMWIENGEIAYPVAEITISGNLGQILNGIEMVGNDLEFRQSLAGPTIKVREMTIGGK
jgi:PmbA protein